MKAVKKFTENGKVVFRTMNDSEPSIERDTDVKIRITHIGICSSDIHVLHGAMKMPDGNTVGHEFTGVVTETGRAVTSVVPGDHVICELAKGACMTCRVCKSGHYELCPSKTPPGWASQGVYAEYTVQPDYCVHKIDPAIPGKVAAMAEPIAICVYGCINRATIAKDDFTVIYGMGSIGLFTLLTLVDAGISNIVCVTPTHKGLERYNMAKDLGASHVLASDEDILKRVTELNKGWKADCVIDCSGNPAAINEGMRLVRKGGKFVGLGIASENPVPFEYNTGVLSVIDLIFSATSSHESWNYTTGLLKRNIKQIESIVTHEFSLNEWQKAFAALDKRKAIKAVLINEIK